MKASIDGILDIGMSSYSAGGSRMGRMLADSLENFDAALSSAVEQGAAVAQEGVMPGGLRFAYLAAPESGVPFLESAHVSAELRLFFDYIKQEQC